MVTEPGRLGETPADAAHTARAVDELLADPGHSRHMGIQGRRPAERKYNSAIQMEKLVAACEQLGART